MVIAPDLTREPPIYKMERIVMFPIRPVCPERTVGQLLGVNEERGTYGAEESGTDQRFFPPKRVDLPDSLVVARNLEDFAGKGLAGAHIAQPFFGNLCQRPQRSLYLAAKITDVPAVEEGEHGDRREHDGHDRSQFDADVRHQPKSGGAGDQSTKSVREILGDALAYDFGIGGEPRDQIADPVGIEKLGVLLEGASEQVRA